MARKRAGGGVVLFFLAVLAVIGGVAVAVWRGTGPLPDPEACYAEVDGREVAVDPEQGQNSALIAAIAQQRGLPARAVTIALATAYQESKIRNIAHGDRDSIGIFQQRPSQGWGTVEQIRDEHYAINKFYEALEKIGDYQSLRVTEAAQKVQRSGFPEAYADHEADARVLASALTGYSGGDAFSCVVESTESRGTAADVETSLTDAFGDDLDVRRGTRQDVLVDVATDKAGNREGWSVAQYLVAWAGPLKIRSVAFDGRIWQTGRDSEKGWTPSPSADADQVKVSLG
ncbi:hypothetical protein ABIE44_000901 [Marmoricola sp. OAE513]|uniref:hypothetical protein n=1 Tax=Marmoricola sp. OAE513 TaxID=2817894 RepID=UPI001AE43D3D